MFGRIVAVCSFLSVSIYFQKKSHTVLNHQSLISYDKKFVFIFMSPFQCSRSASPHKQKIRLDHLIQGLLLYVSMCNLASLLYYMLLLSFSSQLTDCPPEV